MSNHRIHIEQLHLDLQGIAPDTAQSALDSLGPALSQALSERTSAASGGASVRLDSVALPPIRLASAADSQALRTALADQLAGEIVNRSRPQP